MKLAAILLNYNSWKLSMKAVAFLRKNAAVDYVVLVDNKSSDDSYAQLKPLEDAKVSVIRTFQNGGYGSGNNYGVRYAKQQLGATHALILNPDVEVSERLIQRMKTLFQQPQIAIISAAQNLVGKGQYDAAWNLRRKINLILNGEVLLGMYYDTENHKRLRDRGPVAAVDCVAGTMLMVDIDKFLAVGGYDERVFLYFEEEILGWRMKQQGYQTLTIRDESYWHAHSQTIDKFHSLRSKRALLWNSKAYYLEQYLHCKSCELGLAWLFHKIGTVELCMKNTLTAQLQRGEK